jgi:putative two-component system response regulator
LARLEDVEIVSHNSPLAALDWASENSADLAIVDYHMPELNGLAFVQRFRLIPRAEHTLLVMVTADGDRDVRYKALDAGVSDFLTKPVDKAEFTARVSNLMSLARSKRRLADRASWLREEVERATAALASREVEIIVRLTRAAEFRDDVTGMHVIRVGHMCAALARSIGLPDEECDRLMLAAPMHDIGKVAVPDAILNKQGKLTEDEFELMKQHTVAGYRILRDSESAMLQCAAEIALTHHERYDGKGYPDGLKGGAIPLSGRLCSAVDVFDALTSKRPYKQPWTIDEAVRHIDEGSGTQFDPDVVALFHDSLDAVLEIKRRFSDRRPTVETFETQAPQTVAP